MPKELRVHGVSGTPPEDMLYTLPVTYDLGPDLAKVFEPSRDTWEVKAFHWGSLTSKSALTAFWILLAPFAMANVAGWMTESPNLWSRIWTRVAGIALTGILFAQTANIVLDIPYSAGTSQRAVTWMYAIVSLAGVLGLGLLSTQSTFRALSLGERLKYLLKPSVSSMNPTGEDPDWRDPTGGAGLLGSGMWSRHSFLHRLRRLHLGFGMSVLVLVAARASEDVVLGVTAIVLAGVVLVLVALTSGTTSRAGVTLIATAWIPILGLALLVWSIASLATGELAPGLLVVSDEVTFQIALLLGITSGLGLAGELVTGGLRRGWVPLGLLAVAALVGATFGLTGAMLADAYFSSPERMGQAFDGGAGFVTVAMLGLVLVVGATFVGTMLKPRDDSDDSWLRRGVLRARLVLTVAGLYGALAGGVAVTLSCTGELTGCRQANITLPRWMTEDTGDLVVLFGLPFDPSSLLGWAKLLMVAVPAYLIIRSIVGGLLTGQDRRRQVGILWDLGSFWPRWFHPLGPPAYGPYAVTRLQEVLSDETPDVLSAHSQGSLIAAVAISLFSDDPTPRLFLTYGSQIGELYPALFPRVGFDELTRSTIHQVDGRWINLWRPSDPIGGQVIADLGERNWEVTTGRGHSRYELTPEFCAAREVVGANDLTRPPDDQIADCWDTSDR